MEVNHRFDGVVDQAVAGVWQVVDNTAGTNRLRTLPVVPMLVSGDDVTVRTGGQCAIPLTEAYIRHYERLTSKDNFLRELTVITYAPDSGSLTTLTGVAIIGRSFPFHIAYDPVEGLVSCGKELGKEPGVSPCSTINFHVLRDMAALIPQDTLGEHKGRT